MKTALALAVTLALSAPVAASDWVDISSGDGLYLDVDSIAIENPDHKIFSFWLRSYEKNGNKILSRALLSCTRSVWTVVETYVYNKRGTIIHEEIMTKKTYEEMGIVPDTVMDGVKRAMCKRQVKTDPPPTEIKKPKWRPT